MALLLKLLWATYGLCTVRRNHTGPARAVTTDYGRFAYGCSQARKASARARTVPKRAPYGTCRVEVRVLTIPKNTDNPKNARMHGHICMWPCTSKKDFICGLPKGHRPDWLPKSYGQGPLVGIMRCCGHMHTGVLWVIWPCSLVIGLQDTVHAPYMFRKVHVRAPCRPLWISFGHGNIRTFSFEGTVRSRADAERAWDTRTAPFGSGEACQCTLGLYLPCQTRLCDIWPVRANNTTNWPSVGTKSLVAHVWKLYMLNLQPRDVRRPHNSKLFEISCGLEMHDMWFPTGTCLALTVDCPMASCDLGIKYLILMSHALNAWVFPGP